MSRYVQIFERICLEASLDFSISTVMFCILIWTVLMPLVHTGTYTTRSCPLIGARETLMAPGHHWGAPSFLKSHCEKTPNNTVVAVASGAASLMLPFSRLRISCQESTSVDRTLLLSIIITY